MTETNAVLPPGFVPQDKQAMEIVESASGPKGVVDKLRFSRTVKFWKMRRPSRTWLMPRATT